MKRETKIAIVGFGLGFGLFWLLRKYVFSRPGPVDTPKVPKKPSDADLETAVFAYEDALQNNEDPTVLAGLNDTFAEEWNIQVQQRPEDGQLMVTDMKGNIIASYDPAARTSNNG